VMADNINGPAIGFVSFVLVQGLIGFLQGKGLITQNEKIQLLEGLLRNLEMYPVPTDPIVQEARKTIESMIYQA
jgi:hypothetical protein